MARRPKPWFRSARNAWFVTIGGVQHNLGPNKSQAYDTFYQLMRQPQERKVAANSLPAIIDAFLDWVQKHRAEDTYEWYRYRLQRFIERYPDLRVLELRPFHVETWADTYDFSVTSRRNYLRSVKRCLKWAKKQGYIETNPIEDLEVPAADAREIYVPRDEFAGILSYVRDQSLEDLLVVTYETGCRPQESLRVEASNVDLENQRWVFWKSESKGKRISRVVYMTDPAMAIIRRLMLKRPKGKLFCNSRGRAWTTDAVNCGFDRIQVRMGKEQMREQQVEITQEEIAEFAPSLKTTKKCKGETLEKTPAELRLEAKVKLTAVRVKEFVPRYSLYALRHSWATNALKKGLDPLTVAVLLGHTDPSTLAKVYQHLSLNPSHLLDQARKAAS